MMKDQGWKKTIGNLHRSAAAFIKWVMLGSAVGSIVGVMGVLFHFSVEWATEMRQQHSWLLFLLPLGGVVIALLYRQTGMEKDMGTNTILEAVRGEHPLRLRTAPLIFVSTVITHLFGGSSGREGAALQIGGSMGARLADWINLDQKEHQMMIMCGMSSCFAALFGTPLTATIFAIEVISVGEMYYAALLPCITGALIGYGLAAVFHIPPTAFAISGVPHLGLASVGQVILLSLFPKDAQWAPIDRLSGGEKRRLFLLSILCALLSIIFCWAMHAASKAYAKVFPNRLLRAACGGLIVVAMSLLIGTSDFNGAGMQVIQRAMQGEADWYAFLFKLLLTALGAGFKGGEIVPTFFVGATFGCVVGPLLGMDPSFAAAVGLVALFCGVINCPVASFTLSVELFGGEGVIFFGIASVIGYMLSGYSGLYHGQKIIYSKLEPQMIDVHCD